MASHNRVILLGNLVADIELRQTNNGNSVADGRLAVNDRKKNGDEWVEDTVYIDLTFWSRTAEVAAKYTRKGSPIFIEGRLKMETLETQEGLKRNKISVVVEKLQLLGNKSENSQNETNQNKTTDKTADKSIENSATDDKQTNNESENESENESGNGEVPF